MDATRLHAEANQVQKEVAEALATARERRALADSMTVQAVAAEAAAKELESVEQGVVAAMQVADENVLKAAGDISECGGGGGGGSGGRPASATDPDHDL